MIWKITQRELFAQNLQNRQYGFWIEIHHDYLDGRKLVRRRNLTTGRFERVY